jgi:hypothetical protein
MGEGEFQKGEHCPVSLARRSRARSEVYEGRYFWYRVELINQVEDARATMKIFLKVREEYEKALMRDEEVVAGIPAYVLLLFAFYVSLSFFPFSSSSSSPSGSRRAVVSWIEIFIQAWG